MPGLIAVILLQPASWPSSPRPDWHFLAYWLLPGLLAGIGLLKRKSWARILALVVGFFSLFSFPLGTALAIYTFWVLLQDDSDDYFIVPKAI